MYRKKRNSDLCIHSDSFVPHKWKWETIKILLHRAYDICSTVQYLAIELKNVQSTFNKINGYPHWVIFRVFKEIK